MADSGIELRKYQSRIVSTCLRANTIVVLPTGSGKTLIGGEVIKRLSPPALFLVPTCLLVEQQAAVLRSWTGRTVAEHKGGLKIPETFEVLVSTPDAFRIAQRRAHTLLNWGLFAVVIFDEVHHVLKNHPYRKLGLGLSKSSIGAGSAPHPRVVGLTASFSYAVSDKGIEASLTKMCRELLITEMETATSEELKASGYHATGAAAEVSLTGAPACRTLHALSPHRRPSAAAAAARVAQICRGVVPVADRKPHEMSTTFFKREAGGACTTFARLLMACVRDMEEVVLALHPTSSFKSPLTPSAKLAVREWGAYAHRLAKAAGGLPGAASGNCGSSSAAAGSGGGCSSTAERKCVRCGTQGPSSSPAIGAPLAELEHWYEAVRTLVISWEEREDEAVTILDMFRCTGSPSYRRKFQQRQGDIWPGHVMEKIAAFWLEVPATYPRYEHLKEVLLEKYERQGGVGSGGSSGDGIGGGDDSDTGGKAFRGIVFVCQRVTTHALAHVIASDPRLAPIFSTACIYASSSAATASLSVTKAQAQASLRAFRSGRVNLLLSTVVAEEGMDVPNANCVVRYDAMVHAVSLVQGRGRAREENSSFVVLAERTDRTTAHLEAVERQQLRLVKNFRPPADGSSAAAAAAAALETAQRSRERVARAFLLAAAAEDGAGALSTLNIFCSKTKATVEVTWSQEGGGLYVCTLSYVSPLRELHAAGMAPSKKAAKKVSAAKLVAALRAAVPA